MRATDFSRHDRHVLTLDGIVPSSRWASQGDSAPRSVSGQWADPELAGGNITLLTDLCEKPPRKHSRWYYP